MKLLLLSFLIGLCTLVCVQETHAQDGTSLATFNAYLYVLDYRLARRTALINVLKATNLEVLCLQEIWFESDLVKIVETLEIDYPYSWSFVHQDNGQLVKNFKNPVSTCPVKDMLEFAQCLLTQCAGLSGEKLLACGLLPCSSLKYLPDRCVECSVVACAQYVTDPTKIVECLVNSTRDDSLRCQSYVSRTPDKTRGLLMLSKKPLNNVQRDTFYDYPSYLDRGYLQADINNVGTVSCTHTTPLLNTVYVDVLTPFRSYEEQNYYELNLLLEIYQGMDNAIIMGDLNVGPEISEAGIDAEGEENFELVGQKGYVSINVPLAECTYCSNNSLVFSGNDGDDNIIDHILLPEEQKNRTRMVSVIFKTEIVKIDENTTLPLSDHYAVAAVLDPPIMETKTNPGTNSEMNSASNDIDELESLLGDM